MTDIMVKKSFIEKVWPIAEEEFKRSGIYPHIPTIQSAHESDWGRSGLTIKANNLFGFTGESWQQQGRPVIVLSTKEFEGGKWITVNRPFRSYDSWDGSIGDWAKLMQFPRYKDAFSCAKKGDIEGFAKNVASAGYATDPNYADKLVNLYETTTNLLPPILSV